MIRYEKKNLIDGRIDGRLFLAGNGAADQVTRNITGYAGNMS